jgi:dipeptidyl-peptidase 4
MILSLRRFSLLSAMLTLLMLGTPAFATEPPNKEGPAAKADPALTVERIFSSSEFSGQHVPAIRWRKKGPGYLTLDSTPNGQQLTAYDPATSQSTVIVRDHWLTPPGENQPIGIEDFDFSDDESKLLISTNSKRVWRVNSRGDYWVLDLTNRALKKLGSTFPPSTLQFATFSPDGRQVCYVQENNLYVQDLTTDRIKRLTTDGSATVINGTFDWVYEEELDLRRGFRWSPDSQYIAYWQLNTEGVKEFHITTSDAGPYARLLSIRYPKTGETNPAARIGVISSTGGETRWLAIPGDPREHYLAHMEWTGHDIAVQQFNRLQNINRVGLTVPALSTEGATTIAVTSSKVQWILTEKDAAWVENNNEFHWIEDGKQFVWLSERSGWQHAYLVSRDGTKTTPLTQGNFDVIHIDAIDEKGGWLYYTASPDNPTQRYLFRVSLKGGDPERITPTDSTGTNTYQISPDRHWALHTWSRFNTPPVTTLISLPEHKVVKTLADNAALNKKLDTLRRCATEFFRVTIAPGTDLDGWCIKPPDFDPTKKYPVLFHVYGEPAGQTVLDSWHGKQFLWHSMLAQQGYVVMSVDNRGTPAPRGREWRKRIYRQIGILASADQADAVRALLKQHSWMDPRRIAIWGWSGGGSMSLNAIFRYPDLYQTAMAVAPVPNQRFYDTIYQERYMGLPSDNVEGYRNGSPIHFAHQLKGNLLIVHGTADDNCHFLGVEALVDELIAHNKPFTMMAYPNRSHSINEGRNTTRHLYEMLTRYLRTNTPPGPG